MGLWISLWSLCVWFIKWDILGAALFSVLGNDLVEQTNCSLMNYPDIKAGAGASRWGMEPDSKRAEREPHLKGGNSCNALYLCVRLMQRRGVWGHTGGRGGTHAAEGGSAPSGGEAGCAVLAGEEELEVYFGLPTSLGTQGKGEVGGRMRETEKWGGSISGSS